jgi:hypothetical protein
MIRDLCKLEFFWLVVIMECVSHDFSFFGWVLPCAMRPVNFKGHRSCFWGGVLTTRQLPRFFEYFEKFEFDFGGKI